ncbi:hypothetical protein [Gloeocapsopsis crepidinum]|nr:hypothetical protein [Gloeocapsopsis crepidinum]
MNLLGLFDTSTGVEHYQRTAQFGRPVGYWYDTGWSIIIYR